jgi:hypothetical protein
MKKYFVLFLVIFVHFECLSRDLVDFDRFWKILVEIESGGKTNAIGDGGKAIGIAQIHKAYFIDAQQFNKELNKYKYTDCFNPEISESVVRAYLSKYSKTNSFEEWAKLHNGGPGWKNKTGQAEINLIKYWQKFRDRLK